MRQGMAMFTLQISIVLLRFVSQEVMRYLDHARRSPSSKVESPSVLEQRAGRGRLSA